VDKSRPYSTKYVRAILFHLLPSLYLNDIVRGQLVNTRSISKVHMP
jgi:hypothetical protein